MNIKIKFEGKEKYSSGTTYISEPWKDTPSRYAYTYKIYDEDHEDISSLFTIVDDYGDNKHLEHLSLFEIAIKRIAELQNKIKLYEALSEDDKMLFEKFKQIYKTIMETNDTYTHI